MPARHNWFVHVANIQDFEAKLQTETDPEKRALLQRLLEEERALQLPHPADDHESHRREV